MAQIFIHRAHHEPGSRDLTGLDFRIEYDQATAEVSIQEKQPVSFRARHDAYRAVLERLALAMLQTARLPQGITEARLP
jgi:hypothetical protein